MGAPHVPAAAHPGPPTAGPGPFDSLARGATWGTALIPAAIALVGGLIVSVILSLLLLASGGASSVTEGAGLGDPADMSGISFGIVIPFILVALALGGSGVVRFGAGYGEWGALDGALHVVGAPLTISIVMVGLLWWATKRSEVMRPSPNVAATWMRIGISTLALTVVHFLLQLIFAARTSQDVWGGTISIEFSAVTVRSFFLPLLVILVASVWGRVAGHFMGTEAIGAPFLRRIVPAGFVVLVHLAVSVVLLSIVGLIVMFASEDIPWQAAPLLFVNLGAILTSIVHFAGVTLHAGGAFGSFMESGSMPVTLFGSETPGLLWLGVIVVVVAVLVASIVATTTRRPRWTTGGTDPHQWSMVWQAPLAFAVVWGLMSLVVLPLSISLSGSGELMEEFGGAGGARVGIGALAWTFLVFALWGGVVEVLSRTIGPRLVMTVPGAAKLLTGRAIHPYWGQALHMAEPRGALVHPDVTADMAAQAQHDPAAFHDQQGRQDQQGGPPPGPGGLTPPAGGSPMPPAGSAPAVGGSAAYGYGQGPQQVQGGQQFPGAPGPQGPARPFDRRRATLIGGIAGGLAVVLVAGILVVAQVNGRMFGPEGVAQKYFSALSSGDAEAALALADVDVPAESRSLLTNEVLGAAEALPADVSVDDSVVEGDSATVAVSYDIGGSKESVTLYLRKAGKTALFFDDWQLQSPEVYDLAVETPGLDAVSVNGVEVPTSEGALELPAFPALYTVGLAQESEFVTAEPVQSRVFFSTSGEIEAGRLEASPTDAFTSAVESQVTQHIDDCAGSTEVRPAGCPLHASGAWYLDDVSDVSWSVDAYPTVTVQSAEEYGYYGGAEDAAAWYVVTDSPGEATVTGSHVDFGGDTERFDEDATIVVEGTAAISDGEVVFTPAEDDGGW